MLRRFARDDLADRGDQVEAAVRMHVQTVPGRCLFGPLTYRGWFLCPNVSHHPNIGDIISNKHLKVMFKIPKMGHLPTPDLLVLNVGNEGMIQSNYE